MYARRTALSKIAVGLVLAWIGSPDPCSAGGGIIYGGGQPIENDVVLPGKGGLGGKRQWKLGVTPPDDRGTSLTGGATYFPLAEGNHWDYEERRFGITTRWTVTDRKDSIVHLDRGGSSVRLRDRGSEVDIELRGEFGLFYRFVAGSTWEHRSDFGCDDGSPMEVFLEDEIVTTPAGDFQGCLRIEYRGLRCIDAGTKVEWWAPRVGRVKWIEDNFAGPLVFELREFSVEDPDRTVEFLRGDADSDGEVDLSDAVSILSFLFTGGDAPACAKSADSNDSAVIDLSDGVYLLSYLFLGGAQPPAPFPACGEDPTADGLGCGRPDEICL